MKIRAARYEQLHGIMRGRGLPRALMRAEGEIAVRDLCACTHEDARAIPPRRQANDLQRAMMNPSGNWLMLVGTLRDPDLVRLVALEFFARAVLAHIAEPHRSARPLWHQVVGGWGDRLRDDDARSRQYREDAIGHVGALVIDGVTTDCPPEKLEKVRDLVLRHEGQPRMVLVSGGDPLRFGYDRLHRRPDRVAYLNRTVRRADRDQS